MLAPHFACLRVPDMFSMIRSSCHTLEHETEPAEKAQRVAFAWRTVVLCKAHGLDAQILKSLQAVLCLRSPITSSAAAQTCYSCRPNMADP